MEKITPRGALGNGKRATWPMHIACIGDMKNAHKIFVVNAE